MNLCGREIPDILNLTDAPEKMAQLLQRTEKISTTPILRINVTVIITPSL